MNAALRGRGGVRAGIDLLRRSGVLRHPIGVVRILRRHGGSLPAAIELGALRAGSRVAVVRGVEQHTYDDLRRSLRATASALAGRYEVGERVGVETDDTAAGIVLIAAAVAAGLDVLPLGPRLADGDRDLIRSREHLTSVLTQRHVRGSGAGTMPPRRSGRLLLLSSGTAAAPRVTERPRLGLRALIPLADLDRRIAWPRGPVLVLPPLDHGHGLSAVLGGFLRGETMLLASGLPASGLAPLVRRHRPTAVTGVPLQLIRTVRSGALDGAGVSRIISGSSRLADGIAEELRVRTGADIIDCLGTTETGTFAVRHPPAGFHALAGVRIRTDDGELMVRSALAAGEIRTGDTGEVSDGTLTLAGRADGLVDASGELISPSRIAQALRGMPGVRSCEVATAADDLRGTIVTAHVLASASEEELRRSLQAVLGGGGMPQRLVVTAPPPVTG